MPKLFKIELKSGSVEYMLAENMKDAISHFDDADVCMEINYKLSISAIGILNKSKK